MDAGKTATILFLIITLLPIVMCSVKAQKQEENIETFFDSKIPGIRIHVNATAQTQPNKTASFTLKLTPESNVQVKSIRYNLTIYGFVNGTNKIKLYSNTSSSLEFADTFSIPKEIYGITYGEVIIAYNAEVSDPLGGTHQYSFQGIPLGFAMTRVENVYLKMLEEDVNKLKQEQESLLGIQNELGNTRTAVAILGVTTIIFLATTAYLIFRRPKTYW